MLIVTSLTQQGGRERVTGMSKQSNAHHHKANSTRRKRKGHKNEQNDRMLVVTSLTQPVGRERVSSQVSSQAYLNKGERERATRMNKQSNAHRHIPNSTRRKRKGHKNEQTIECSSLQA